VSQQWIDRSSLTGLSRRGFEAMRKIGDSIELSASDLVAHLNCRYLTDLDIAVANGALAKPNYWDPLLETLRERGLSRFST
jgi:hypothetical protein